MDIQVRLNILVSRQRQRRFPISGITSIQHTNAPKHSQHYSASHSGESFTYWGLCIWFFGYVIWVLKYFIDLILFAFSFSYGGEFYLRLWYFDLRPRCRLYPFSLQYLMWRRVTKGCTSGFSALLFGPYSADLIFFALKISRGGDCLPVTTHAFNHLILWLSSEELGVPCRPYPFCLQYFMRGEFYLLWLGHLILIHIFEWPNSLLRSIAIPWPTLLLLAVTSFAFRSQAKSISRKEHL